MEKDKLIDQGWSQMHVLLDEELPQERKRRPIVWWFTALGVLAMIVFLLVQPLGSRFIDIGGIVDVTEADIAIGQGTVEQRQGDLTIWPLTETGSADSAKTITKDASSRDKVSKAPGIDVSTTGDLNSLMTSDGKASLTENEVLVDLQVRHDEPRQEESLVHSIAIDIDRESMTIAKSMVLSEQQRLDQLIPMAHVVSAKPLVLAARSMDYPSISTLVNKESVVRRIYPYLKVGGHLFSQSTSVDLGVGLSLQRSRHRLDIGGGVLRSYADSYEGSVSNLEFTNESSRLSISSQTIIGSYAEGRYTYMLNERLGVQTGFMFSRFDLLASSDLAFDLPNTVETTPFGRPKFERLETLTALDFGLSYRLARGLQINAGVSLPLVRSYTDYDDGIMLLDEVEVDGGASTPITILPETIRLFDRGTAARLELQYRF